MKVKKLLIVCSILFLLAPLTAVHPANAQEEKPFIGYVLPGKHQTAFDNAVRDDFDGDGFEELTLYYMDDVLVASAEDTNMDGTPDLWFRYTKDWQLDLEAYDIDFDGAPDEFLTIDENEQVVEVENTAQTEPVSDKDSQTGGTYPDVGKALLILLLVSAAYYYTSKKK